MIFNCKTVLLIIFIMYHNKSVNSAKLSVEGEECRNNIYKEYSVISEDPLMRTNPRKIILHEAFRYKVLSDMKTDDSISYFKEMSNNILSNDTDYPRQFCEKITIDLVIDDGIKKYFECIGQLLRYFLDSEDPGKVIKDAFLNREVSVFNGQTQADYARLYFNYMDTKISYSYRLPTPVQFCGLKYRKARNSNSKKRNLPDSEAKLQSASPKTLKFHLPSTSGSNEEI